MSDAYYDITVIGTELPGLITAAMLAKKGYRVLVLGEDDSRNHFVHEGYNFIRRPWLFNGFETSPLIKKVFSELSLSLEMHNRPKSFDPFFQVVFPDKRIDVVGLGARYDSEMKREFPDDVQRIKGFHKQVQEMNTALTSILDAPVILPPEGFAERRAFKKATQGTPAVIEDPLAHFDASNPFRTFVLAPLLFESGCQVAPFSPIQLVRSVSHLHQGIYYIDGGIDGLKDIFIEKIRSNCGDYREKVHVQQIVMKRGRAREIIIRDRREVIGCDVLVCNTNIKRFFGLIPQEDQKQRFHLRVHELQPSHLLYTINFALRAEAIPTGMGRHVFLVCNPAKPLEGDNLILLCLDPAEALDNSQAETRVVSATVRLPAHSVRPTVEHIRAYEEKIVQQIKRIIPFFDEHLLAQASTCLGFDKRTRKPFVDVNHLIPILSTPLADTLDSSPVTCRTAYRNILVTGNHLHAGLGFEGAFLASLNAVQLTSELVSRRSLLN